MEESQRFQKEQNFNKKSRKTVWGYLSLLLALVLIFAVLFLGYRSRTETPSENTQISPTQGGSNPIPNDEYKALQSVNKKPSVANKQGGIVVSKKGVGSKIEDVPTIDIYMDFLCPPCGNLHRTIDPTLKTMINAGQVNVELHFMDFLDRLRSDQYSSRAVSAAVTVAQEDPEHFFDVVESFYQEDFMPAEENGKNVSDEQFAQRMITIGIPEEVAKKAASGEYIEWAKKLNAYTVTRDELRHPEGENKGKMTTPTILINNTYLQIDRIKSGQDSLKLALLQSIGLDESKVGKPGVNPEIGDKGKPHDIER